MMAIYEIYLSDAYIQLESFKVQDRKFRLIYIDPPFATGRDFKEYKDTLTIQNPKLEGLVGVPYLTLDLEGYLLFMLDYLALARELLTDDGSIFIHLDYRAVHYIKVLMDYLFGRENFRNEIIWAYDYGGGSKKWWPRKHDNILWYTKSSKYIFNYEEMDRIPYMAPGLVGKEKASKGKTPTDVWWHTIVPTNGRERTGYPTQKPLGILERIVKVHSHSGDWLLDFFAGSGSFGEAALKHDRNVVLVDKNPNAVKIMKERLSRYIEE